MIAVSVLTARCRQRWSHANADLERPRTAAGGGVDQSRVHQGGVRPARWRARRRV